MVTYTLTSALYKIVTKETKKWFKNKEEQSIKGRTNITKEKKFSMKSCIDDERKTPVNEQRLTK